MLEHSYPSYQHNIPDPISMNICKLGIRVDLKSDTCNGVRKTRRIVVEQVHEAAEALRKDESDYIRVLEVDCCNHLINVCLGGMTKSLSNLLDYTLRD